MSALFREYGAGGLSWLSLAVLGRQGIRHGFTLRRGGASRGKFSSLSFTSRQGDLPERVKENWRRLEGAAGLGRDGWSLLSQVHGAAVVEASAGRPAGHRRKSCPAADGVVTTRRGIALGVLTADCLPLLIGLPGGRGTAAVHAGWRGTVEGVAVEAVKALAAASGADPGEMAVGLGPCIGACCYEVGEEVREVFRLRWGASLAGKAFSGSGPWRFDLQKANRLQLVEAGVRSARIAALPLCTACRKDLFFSHRRDGERTGRMLAFASLVPE